MSLMKRLREIFGPHEALPPLKLTTREDDVTCSHVLYSTAHEVQTSTRAASRTVQAKAAGLSAEVHRARQTLFPEPGST